MTTGVPLAQMGYTIANETQEGQDSSSETTLP